MFAKLRLVAFALIALTACSKDKPAEPTTEPAKENTETTVSPAAEPPAAKTIKLGQTMPYSGPASAYGTIGRLHTAYFKMLNEQGGINGRKVELTSLDDTYSPPKTVEQTRRLVEQDNVAAVVQSVGTAPNSAVHKYLNTKKVPQLFVSTGASKWNDPRNFPYTIGFNPSYRLEGRTYAAHILKHTPKAKIAVLYQNDDYGKDLLEGLKEGLGAQSKMIVAEASYEASDPTVDSQITTLKASKANVLVDITTPKFAAQAIRRVYDLGWKPVHYLNNVGASVGAVLVPAGLEKATGAHTTQFIKDPNDPQWANDAEMQKFKTFMKTYYPEGDAIDANNAYAYVSAQALAQVLKQCGDDVSSDNILKQATSLKNYTPELILPGLAINTAPNDYETFDQLRLATFDGKTWVADKAEK
ncbi:MAG TPA: ABC transporter substrate-binding protein [Polyangiales bacterium]|nr:ABC transporter substrate-binding protein [Polyangiales bacterium]